MLSRPSAQNTIFWPSGDQTGPPANAQPVICGQSVSRVTSRPPGLIV